MSGLVDRITAAVHLPNTVFPSGIQCSCDRTLVLPPEQWAAHVAERVAAELQLTELLALRDRHREEPWRDGTGSNCWECNGRRFPCPTRQVLDRLLSGWTAVEAQP